MPTYSSGKTHLAFVTDGDPGQCLGICHILNALSWQTQIQNSLTPIWIVGPQQHEKKILRWFELGSKNRAIRFIAALSHKDDRYYIQLGLNHIIELLRSRDHLLALDYDHLVLDPFRFPFSLAARGISVSSETSESFGLEHTGPTASRLQLKLPKKHYGASLIFGNAAELKQVGKLWHNAYDDLRPTVSARYRVEIALALAAERASIDLVPCPIHVQANFSLPSLECCLFHYGGETTMALMMKEQISQEARVLLRKGIREELIREIALDLTRQLIAHLKV